MPLASSGTNQQHWGEQAVDVAAEVAQALTCMDAPMSASQQQVQHAYILPRLIRCQHAVL